MGATSIGYHGVLPIPEIRFQRTVDISSLDFDGTDTANMSDDYKSLQANNSKFNPWKKGFLIQAPSTDGVLYALTYEDYTRQGQVVDDTLKQPITMVAGQYMNVRVVKLYTADNTSDTSINIGI